MIKIKIIYCTDVVVDGVDPLYLITGRACRGPECIDSSATLVGGVEARGSRPGITDTPITGTQEVPLSIYLDNFQHFWSVTTTSCVTSSNVRLFFVDLAA